MQIADILKNSVVTIKTERNERAALETCLQADLRDAVALLTEQIKYAGLRANVDAVVGSGRECHSATGAEAASGVQIRFVAAVGRWPTSAYEHGRDLLHVRWRPVVEESDDDDGREEGWATTDDTSERWPTAIEAVTAALQRPATARRVGEMLIELGA